MTIWFIAVRNNLRADGFMIANGEVFVARSGRNVADVSPAERQKVRYDGKVHDYDAERGDIPPGTFLMGPATELTRENKLTMTNGQGDVSRITQGKIRLRVESVDLESVVNAAVESARAHRLVLVP